MEYLIKFLILIQMETYIANDVETISGWISQKNTTGSAKKDLYVIRTDSKF